MFDGSFDFAFIEDREGFDFPAVGELENAVGDTGARSHRKVNSEASQA